MAITNVPTVEMLQTTVVQEKFLKIFPLHGKLVDGVMT
jgi:hypothetical protein